MLQTERKVLRKKILARRNSLPSEERRRKSSAIMDALWKIAIFSQAKTVFIYVNYKSEVETLPLIRQCLEKNMGVAVPLTVPETGRLIPYLIRDPSSDLQPGYCSIPEPVAERLQPIQPGSIEAIILPGSVFDANGGRLGYGGGYYDRFLEQDAPQAARIGVAFECQMVASVPLLPHDQRLHYLVTEERVIKIAAP